MTEVVAQVLNKTTLHFQLLPMPKVDQSLLRMHEAPPLQKAKSQVIPTREKHTCFYKIINFSVQFSAIVNTFIVKT